jgi:hypothetical protein
MFSGCALLKKAPDLPATKLVQECYEYMFNGCYNLNYIKIYADYNSSSHEIYDKRCLRQWVADWGNTQSSGKFYKKQSTWLPEGSYPTDHKYWCSGIPNGWTPIYI